MSLAASMVTGLLVVVVLLVRSRELRIWHVVLVGLLGFYLARTSLATPIDAAVMWLLSGLTHTS